MFSERVHWLSLAIALAGALSLATAAVPLSSAFGWGAAREAAGAAIVGGGASRPAGTSTPGPGRGGDPGDARPATPQPRPIVDITPIPTETAAATLAGSETPPLSPADEVEITQPGPSMPAAEPDETPGYGPGNLPAVTITPAPAPTRAPVAEKEREAAANEAASAVASKGSGGR